MSKEVVTKCLRDPAYAAVMCNPQTWRLRASRSQSRTAPKATVSSSSAVCRQELFGDYCYCDAEHTQTSDVANRRTSRWMSFTR